MSGLLLLALACSQSATQSQSQESEPSPTATAESDSQPATQSQSQEPGPSPTATAESGSQPVLRAPTGPPPKVDTSIASVPIEDILFDTFTGRFIRLSEASDADIENLRDRIRPIYEPEYRSAEGDGLLPDSDMVIGYVSQSGASFAYPVRILNFHEIVNDVIDGVPLLISYCPLCASGIVYSRELEGRVLLFGNTNALYESDLVMYDHQTGSYWFQVIGEAVVGPLTGKRLKLLPSMTITWGQWRELHPDTRLLTMDLGRDRNPQLGSPYDRDPFEGYASTINRGRFAFPVTEEKLDDRLRPGDMVFAVEVGESHKAYPLTGRADQAINDEVGGQRVVVIVRSRGPAASAYFSTLDGRTFSFSLNEGVVEDAETGSRWDGGGRAVSGPMAGAQLAPVPSRTSFWFSLVGALPGIELHE